MAVDAAGGEWATAGDAATLTRAAAAFRCRSADCCHILSVLADAAVDAATDAEADAATTGFGSEARLEIGALMLLTETMGDDRALVETLADALGAM